MDLGIAGRRAVVCASSRGLGKGCAMALAREGVHVVVNGTTPETLERTAQEIRAAAIGEVTAVVADVTTAEGRKALLDACPDPDILINNAGGPPPGDFRDWTRADWIKALDANMISAIELIKATLDGMIERRFGRIVNITSGAVKSPISFLGLSNGARSGLTGFVTGLAREVSRHNVTINNLLPGSFDTDRLKSNARRNAEREGRSFEEQYRLRMKEESSGRYGTPEEFGAVCAFLCAAQSGYITRQNLLLDGGTFPGVL
jgi:3-oxoacyl-[acyl-carrier protein] reductase